MEVTVVALRSFEHDRTRRVGDQFRCSLHIAKKLASKGLVEIPDYQPPAENPTGAAGTPSSASPADPASPQTTSSESSDGDSEHPPDSETAPPPETKATSTKASTKASTRRSRKNTG